MANAEKACPDPCVDDTHEMVLIGALLQAPDDVLAICAAEGVTGDSFTNSRSQGLFLAAHRISKNGGVLDLVTITSEMETDFGGGMIDYAAGLVAMCPTTTHAAHYAGEVKKAERKRWMLAAAKDAVRAGERGESADDLARRFLLAIEASEAEKPRSRIVSAVEFDKKQIVEPPQVIKGVLRAQMIGMMAAASKAGKSWALLDMCLSVSGGRKWMNWETTAGRVLYVNAELPEWDLQRRMKVLCQARGFPEVPANLDVWHLRADVPSFKDLIPEIVRRQKALDVPYHLIVPDPMYSFGGGRDENDNAEQAVTMGELRTISERTGAGVWVSHHFSKGNKHDVDHLDRASGAGMFTRFVDAFMTFTRHEEENCYSVETTVRGFAKPEPFVARFDYPVWTIKDELDPSNLKKNAGGAPSKYTVDKIAALLPLEGFKHNKWFLIAQEKLGISHGSFCALVKKGVETRELQKLGDVYIAAIEDV